MDLCQQVCELHLRRSTSARTEMSLYGAVAYGLSEGRSSTPTPLFANLMVSQHLPTSTDAMTLLATRRRLVGSYAGLPPRGL